jgi:hypothetical protein
MLSGQIDDFIPQNCAHFQDRILTLQRVRRHCKPNFMAERNLPGGIQMFGRKHSLTSRPAAFLLYGNDKYFCGADRARASCVVATGRLSTQLRASFKRAAAMHSALHGREACRKPGAKMLVADSAHQTVKQDCWAMHICPVICC